MQTSRSSQVVVIISDSAISKQAVAPLFSQGTPTTVVKISTTCAVTAQLIGTDFSISPPDPQQQSFLGSTGVLEWTWSVTPTAPGDLQLTLEIDPVYQVSGVNEPGQSQYYQKKIDVTSEPSSVSDTLDHDLSTPLSAAIITGLVTAIVAFLLTRRFERRRPQCPPST
jgi:hypothetical protein